MLKCLVWKWLKCIIDRSNWFVYCLWFGTQDFYPFFNSNYPKKKKYCLNLCHDLGTWLSVNVLIVDRLTESSCCLRTENFRALLSPVSKIHLKITLKKTTQVKPNFKPCNGRHTLTFQILMNVHLTLVLKEGPVLMVLMHLSVYVHNSGLEQRVSLVSNYLLKFWRPAEIIPK